MSKEVEVDLTSAKDVFLKREEKFYIRLLFSEKKRVAAAKDRIKELETHLNLLRKEIIRRRDNKTPRTPAANKDR